MLSNKWTFSLTCLVVLFALGFAVAPVMAHSILKDDGAHLQGDTHLVVDFGLDASVIDVSSHDNADAGIEEDIQIDAGRVRSYFAHPRPFVPMEEGDDDADAVPVLTFLVEFNKGVPLTAKIYGDDPRTPLVDESDTTEQLGYYEINPIIGFGLDDIVIEAFDEFGRSWGRVTLEDTTEGVERLKDVAVENVATIAFTNPGGTPVLVPGERVGRQFTVEVYLQALKNLEKLLAVTRGGDFEIATLIFSFNAHSVTEWATLAQRLILQDPDNYEDDPDNKGRKRLKAGLAVLAVGPEKPHNIRIDLVDIDEGDPKYRDDAGEIIVIADDAKPVQADTPVSSAIYVESTDLLPHGSPNVVSITRLRGTSDDIDTPLGFNALPTSPSNADVFMAKVVLTEQPDASFLGNNGADLISVENGVVIGIDAGLPFGNAAEGPDPPDKDAVLPPVSEGGYSDDQEEDECH